MGQCVSEMEKERQQQAEALFQEGSACLDAGQVKEALELFRRAAGLGSARSEKVLDTVQRPLSKKAFVKRNAAVTQYNEGLLCYREERWEEAFDHFREAAGQGLPEAQFTLSVLYAGGKGVGQDLEEALRWAQEAAGRGYEKAQRLVPALREMLRKRRGAE